MALLAPGLPLKNYGYPEVASEPKAVEFVAELAKSFFATVVAVATLSTSFLPKFLEVLTFVRLLLVNSVGMFTASGEADLFLCELIFLSGG